MELLLAVDRPVGSVSATGSRQLALTLEQHRARLARQSWHAALRGKFSSSSCEGCSQILATAGWKLRGGAYVPTWLRAWGHRNCQEPHLNEAWRVSSCARFATARVLSALQAAALTGASAAQCLALDVLFDW